MKWDLHKPLLAALASAGFLFLLATVHVVHARWFRVDVVFYGALLDVLLAALAMAAVLMGAKRFDRFSGFEKVQLFAIWLLTGYALAISVPTVIDRSLSFYLLEKLQQRGGSIRQDAFAQIFVEEYMPEHRLVDVRLTEQLASGTVVINNGCVSLTEHGQRLARFSRYYRLHFLPRQRLLLGEYSDALVDPFRASATEVDYRCEPEASTLPPADP